MAGTRIEIQFDSSEVRQALDNAGAVLGDPTLLLRDIGEMLVNSTRVRFGAQHGPDGTPWQALSPRYLAVKNPNPGKVLHRHGHLLRQIFAQLDGSGVLVGTDRVYGAIHQFGGEIKHQAREAEVYFKQDRRTGEVGNRFVKKQKSNFAQRVQVGAYSTTMPARPFLGVSAADAAEILEIAQDHLRAAIERAGS